MTQTNVFFFFLEQKDFMSILIVAIAWEDFWDAELFGHIEPVRESTHTWEVGNEKGEGQADSKHNKREGVLQYVKWEIFHSAIVFFRNTWGLPDSLDFILWGHKNWVSNVFATMKSSVFGQFYHDIF